jgi:hypothetical protein
MRRKRYVKLKRLRKVIHNVLDLHQRDSVYLPGLHRREVCPERGVVMSYGPPDLRRNANPLDLKPNTRWAFADEPQSTNWKINVRSPKRRRHYYQAFTNASGICLETHKGKALQYARRRGPEPSLKHFVDLLEIASVLDERALTIVNLPGSGASVPHNFHTQIVPLRYWQASETRPDTVRTQLRNIQTLDTSPRKVNKIRVTMVTLPVFGLTLDFSDYSSKPERIAKKLFAAVHEAVRYDSQLFLSYNLYIQSGGGDSPSPLGDDPFGEHPDWRRVTVLFRESRLERICETEEMFDLVRKRAGRAKAEAIRCSDNRHWRWGWWEMIGGLWVRDDSFDDDRFDKEFWRSVYDILTVKDHHRFRILKRVIEALK